MNPAFSGWRSYALVEPPVLLLFFGQALAGSLTSSVVINQGIEYLEKFHDSTIISSVEYVNNILAYKFYVDILVPALLIFFLGPWSDRYGRKPLLVAACAGSAASFLLWSCFSSVGPVNPWIYLVASLPATLVGGYFTMMLATHCYITDIRQESDRAWHFTLLQAVIFIGQVLGFIANMKMQEHYDYATICGVAFVANVIAMLYVIFFVPESVTRHDAKPSCCSLFNPSLIKDMFVTCVRKRDFNRVLIWCCVCFLAINVLIREGEQSISIMFIYDKFGWDTLNYFWYTMGVMLLIIIGTIVGGLICKAFIDRTMASMTIAVLAATSALAGSIVKSCTTELWHLYLSAFLGILGGLSAPVVRNALSKSVPPQDVGKVFSLTTSMEAIILLASGRLYYMVYSHYNPPIYPWPVYLVSVGLYAFIILIALTIKLKNPPLSTTK